MSAELLRKAATILRERAEAATPGPWSSTYGPREKGRVWADDDSFAPIAVMVKPAMFTAKDTHADAIHMATMHPGVGLALADWLGHCAERAYLTSEARLQDDPEERDWYDRALTVARLIVGEQP